MDTVSSYIEEWVDYCQFNYNLCGKFTDSKIDESRADEQSINHEFLSVGERCTIKFVINYIILLASM